METVNKRELLIPKNQESIRKQFSKDSQCQEIIRKNNCEYLNPYAGEPVIDLKGIASQIATLISLYGKENISPEFAREFTRAVIDYRMSERQVSEYVDRVIREVPFSKITIGDILKYRTNVKLYRYMEMCEMITSNSHKQEDFIPKKVNGTTYFVLKRDVDYESQ